MRTNGLAVLGFLVFTAGADAQEAQPRATPKDPSEHSGAPLGQFTVGPFIVTPTFRIGNLAVDTNVRYTTRRTSDFLASGGPGLDLALPFADHWKLDVQGFSEYYYFFRSEDLRRWTGGGEATLMWRDTGTVANVSARVFRDFSRPNFEVDTRLARTVRAYSASFERDIGRLTLAATPSYTLSRTDEGQLFRGADLASALNIDRFDVNLDLRYRLTPVTSLLFEGGYSRSRFAKVSSRDYSEENGGAGLLMTGLIDGRVTAGVRRTRLLTGSTSRVQPYIRGDLAQRLGRRLRLAERYAHESIISAFATNGELPTFERRSLSVDLTILLTPRLDLRLGGTRDRTKSDGLVQVIGDNGSPTIARRDDTAYIARADVGLRLGRARLALFTSYTTRESLYFADFGIKGLQAGARVEYAPQ